MNRSIFAILTAIVGGLLAAAAFAETTPQASSEPTNADSGSWGDASCGDAGVCPSCFTNYLAAPSYECNRYGMGGLGCGSDCGSDGCCLNSDTSRLFDNCSYLQKSNTTLTGWVDGGIMGNSRAPATHFNGPVTFPDRDNAQLNQLYGALRRTTDLSKNCGWFLGGEVDLFFGSDSFFTTAAGLDGRSFGNVPRWNTDQAQRYGWSMPQMYAETDYDNLRIKWGHFYTILGYETVPAVGNFFYTHSYALQYGQPLTHTGALASSNLNDNWSWHAGIVSGWNDFNFQDGAQFLGGLTYTNPGSGSLAFAVVSGNQSNFNIPGIPPSSNRTMYSLVWTRNLCNRWTYVLHHSLGVQQNTEGFNALDSRRAAWYGINQYLFYAINDCWTVGARAEWFNDPQGYLVTGLRPGNTDAMFRFPGSFYETSLGLNYKPNGNFTLRGELRYDWYSGPGGFIAPAVPGVPPNQPFGDNLSNNQFLFGLDAIYQF